jgi:hypothetical protein
LVTQSQRNESEVSVVRAATPLPALIDRATRALSNARTSAEILEARDQASVIYDVAKSAARLAKAKGAHDSLLAAAHRSQADALEIMAGAKRRLADEYDLAQERGEVASSGDTLRKGPGVPKQNSGKATAADIGLTRKEIHEARQIRDAELADPGIVRRTIDAAVAAGEEPSKAKVRRAAVNAIAKPKVSTPKKKKRRRIQTGTVNIESQHDRDLRMICLVWDGTCETARVAFLKTVQSNSNH